MLKWAMAILNCCLIGCTTRLTGHGADGGVPVSTIPIPAGAVRLSPRNTQIRFVGSALLNSHEGTFTRFSGWFWRPGPDPAMDRLFAEIDMDSVYTEIPLLTKHLKAADFFDAAQYPKASFSSTHIQPAPDSGTTRTITGSLTLHGQTKTMSFPASFENESNTLLLRATFTIRQSDFGMNAAKATTDEVPVTIVAQLPRP